jgi:hypothetical protein
MDADYYIQSLITKRQAMLRCPQVETRASKFQIGHQFFQENKLAGGDYDSLNSDEQIHAMFKKERVCR